MTTENTKSRGEKGKRGKGSGSSAPLPSKGGRPAKITLKTVAAVGELMALGVPEEYACALHGVNPETFGPAVSRKPEFKEAMKRHHAAFMARACRAIADGGEVHVVHGEDKEGNPVAKEERRPWTGLAWLLERRYRPHFNKVDQHAFSQPDGSGLCLSPADMLQLEEMAKELHVRQRGKGAEGKGGRGDAGIL